MSHLYYATKFNGGADRMNVLEVLDCANTCKYLTPWTNLRKLYNPFFISIIYTLSQFNFAKTKILNCHLQRHFCWSNESLRAPRICEKMEIYGFSNLYGKIYQII